MNSILVFEMFVVPGISMCKTAQLLYPSLFTSVVSLILHSYRFKCAAFAFMEEIENGNCLSCLHT